MPRKTIYLLLLTIAAALLAAVAFFRDTTPPEFIAIDLPTEAPSDEPLIVPFQMSEPVVLEIITSVEHASVEGKTGEVPIVLAPGPQTLRVLATDRAGNETAFEHEITGRTAPTIRVAAPDTARRADAMTLAIHMSDDEYATRITDIHVEADGQHMPVHTASDGVIRGFWSTPLAGTADDVTFSVRAIDQFGREHRASAVTSLVPRDDVIFEVLELSNETLNLSTPEARELEAEIFDKVYANASANPFPAWTEGFIQPSEGWTSSNFGDERQYSEGGNISYHTGHDLATPQGTPIHATNDGTVVVAEMLPLKGGTVAIDHGAGVVSIYMHQSEIIANVGDRVTRGDVVGLVGTTGLSTGPHLHWEMRIHGVESAPSYYIGLTYP